MTMNNLSSDTSSLEALFGIEMDGGQEQAGDPSATWAQIKCRKCRGTGNFVGWSGRVVGKCFACKGNGVHVPDKDEPAKPAIDVSKIEKAFATARERAKRPGMMGIWTRPLTLRSASGIDVKFQPGSVGSQWEGMIFCKNDSDQKKLGYVKNGTFTARRECTPEEQAAVFETAADPYGAAKAFGKAYSVCTVCGRTLLNDVSIEIGIGPICRERYGW